MAVRSLVHDMGYVTGCTGGIDPEGGSWGAVHVRDAHATLASEMIFHNGSLSPEAEHPAWRETVRSPLVMRKARKPPRRFFPHVIQRAFENR